jgi:hypothetical protein
MRLWFMIRDLIETAFSSLGGLGIGGGTIVVLAVLFWIGTLILLPVIIIALPAGYLTRDEKFGEALPTYRLWHYPYLVVKNILGAIFILAGLAMLVLPGQGLLTLALGLALISFPGKHRAIQRIVGRKKILAAINRLRIRARKPPLAPPDE